VKPASEPDRRTRRARAARRTRRDPGRAARAVCRQQPALGSFADPSHESCSASHGGLGCVRERTMSDSNDLSGHSVRNPAERWQIRY
jgi:hypothetical protein